MNANKIELLNCKLPQKNLSTIRAVLEANAMPVIVPESNGWFNCWAFVAYYCHWIKEVYWMEEHTMEEYLRSNTFPISRDEVKAGDIAVFRRGTRLSHTAIVMPDPSVVYHKPGGTPLCIDALEKVSRNYGEYTFAREIEKILSSPLDNSGALC